MFSCVTRLISLHVLQETYYWPLSFLYSYTSSFISLTGHSFTRFPLMAISANTMQIVPPCCNYPKNCHCLFSFFFPPEIWWFSSTVFKLDKKLENTREKLSWVVCDSRGIVCCRSRLSWYVWSWQCSWFAFHAPVIITVVILSVYTKVLLLYHGQNG